jgi:hypothetical protein
VSQGRRELGIGRSLQLDGDSDGVHSPSVKRLRSPGRIVLLGFAGLGAMLLFGRSARACSCDRQKPEEAFAAADAVFIGRVSDAWYEKEWEFEILAAFKGVQPDTDVRIHTEDGMCQRRYEFGELYLIYAYQSGDELHDSDCSRSNLIVLAAKDVEYLEDRWWDEWLRESGVTSSSSRCSVDTRSGQSDHMLVLVGLASILAASRRRRWPVRTSVGGRG